MKRPDFIFPITMNGEIHEVKMTYALHMELMQIIPEPQNIGELLLTDQSLRDYIIRRVLSGHKRITNEDDLIDLYEVDISMDEIDNMVIWVGDHILYFFTTSMKKVVGLGQKYEKSIIQLVQSKNGSENLDSKEDSSGASSVVKAT